MKKILFILAVVLTVFLIYLATMDRKVYYLALGDSSKYSYDNSNNKVYGYSYYLNDYLLEKDVLEKYVYVFASSDDRISDVINYIKNNKKKGEYTVKNSLIKADLVTLHFNGIDIFNRISDDSLSYNEVYNYIDDLIDDLDGLFSLMRQYCKEDIVFIGYNNPFSSDEADSLDVMEYIDKRVKDKCLKYDIEYVSLNDLNLSSSFKYLDERDYKTISSRVIDISVKKVFET